MSNRDLNLWPKLALVSLLFAATGCAGDIQVGELQTETHTVELQDAESVRVEIEMGAGELAVAGGADQLLDANFTFNVTELRPDVAYEVSGDRGMLTVQQPDVKNGMSFFKDLTDYRNEWELRLSDDVPIDMRVELGAGASELQMSGLSLTSLYVSSGAGETTVDLTGDWDRDLDVHIEGGVGEITVRLPGNIGVSVEADVGIGSVDAPSMTKDGDTYTNDAYGQSDVTLTVEIDGGVGEITLKVEPTTMSDADGDNGTGQSLDADVAGRLQAALEAVVESQDTNYPGAVLHVSSHGMGTWTGSAGLGEIDSDTAMRPDDRFRAGSLTKPFISTVILQLVEEGLFGLDDTLPEVLPENVTSRFADSEEITVRMLLNHTGGLPDFMGLAGPEIIGGALGGPDAEPNPDRIWTDEEFLDFASQMDPLFAPGTGQGYSNTDYLLLGILIEEATGRSWREEFRERIIEEVGLENTVLPDVDDRTIPGNHARGYADFGGGVMDVTEIVNASVVGAAGGQSLITTPEDLARALDAVLAGDLFQDATTLDEMQTWVDWPDGNPLSSYLTSYGLGLAKADLGGDVEGIGHGGDTEGGYSVFVFHLPDHDMTISGAVNSLDFLAGFSLIPSALEILLPDYSAGSSD